MKDLTDPKYTPQHLLNKAMELMGFTTDTALANAMGMDRQAIYKVRARHIAAGPSFLWRLHLLTGVDGKTLKEWGGME